MIDIQNYIHSYAVPMSILSLTGTKIKTGIIKETVPGKYFLVYISTITE